MSINMSNNQPVLKYFYLDIAINWHPAYSTMSCSQVLGEYNGILLGIHIAPKPGNRVS